MCKELKKCPFCGEKASLEYDTYGSRYECGYYVQCVSLSCGVNPATWIYATKEKAIESWNRRADDSQSKAQLATENYNIGYVEGYEQGKECGYDKGYNAGYNEGLNEGYEMAKRIEGTEGNG